VLLPAAARVRVRGVQVHGKAVERARAGQRTAVNLGGVEASLIERGMVLAPTDRLRPTQIMDVQLDVLKSASRPLRSRSRVRVHLGAAEVLGRVRVLSRVGEIAPGESGFAQLRLESPVVALPNERFIIRSYSPSRTVGGGRVLDSSAVKHRGREAGLMHARLAALAEADEGERVAYFVETSGEKGMRRAELAARTGWLDDVLERAAALAISCGAVVAAEGVLFSRADFERLGQQALAEVEAFHKREPLARGLMRETLRERHFTHAPAEVFRAVVSELEKAGAIVSEKEVVRVASHSLSLSAEDAALRDRLEQLYSSAAFEPPTFDEALSKIGTATGASNKEHGRKILQLLIEAGQLVRVQNELFFHRDALAGLKIRLAEYGARHEPERLIDVAAFKEMAGVSRKYAIPLLEYFDRERVTRRAGDKRIIL
jgi:selenocysteine-specific elongation factor